MSQRHDLYQILESKYTWKSTIENFHRIFNIEEVSFNSFNFEGESWTPKFLATKEALFIKIKRLLSLPYNRYLTNDRYLTTTRVGCSHAVTLISDVCFYDFSGKVIFTEQIRHNFPENRAQAAEYVLSTVTGTTLGLMKTARNPSVTVEIVLASFKMKYCKSVAEKPSLTAFDSSELYVQKSLCDDLLKMYENNSHTDVVLNINGEKLNAHKTILCSKSPVFAKMFALQMAESRNNIVDIEDVRLEIVKELLNFMYSRVKLGYDFKTAIDVYYAADKYEVMQLREICGKILLKNLETSNALELLQMADRHNDVVLKQAVMEFVNSKFKSCVVESWWPNFAFEKSELFEELMKFIK